ncbi:DEAD-domain-containing protein [Hesseltinella vesiculosa]|uniref:ATP-dependent RNA helicase n=1 Tax=Hesseltinella vesiculosa TaxID=101127 RepID=A0A1X2GHV9_9FUNG|nr:DEAD-domain-containing protein [Hesseltinella vesiculosa]
MFPDFASQKQHTQEDIQILRNMGIPEWLLQPTVVDPEEACPLNQVGLSPRLIERCEEQGLANFFAVQMKVIPVFLRRQALYDSRHAPGDLCISAPTGSGKTMAYVLPIVDILSKRVVTRLRALIVLPTRDLVQQVKETFDAFVKGTNLKVGIAVGQHSYGHERSILVGNSSETLDGGVSKVDILIATPGRLMDHLKETPNFTLQHLRFLVIDEADRLLNQNYQDWLNHILSATRPPPLTDDTKKACISLKTNPFGVMASDAMAPSFIASRFNLPTTDLDLPKIPSVQKLLFSATLTKDPGKIASLHLVDPEYISVQGMDGTQQQYATPAGLKEHMTMCATAKKPVVLIYLLYQLKVKRGLCFTKSVESARQLRLLLDAYNKALPADQALVIVEYSSDLANSKRKALMKQFKDGQVDLMICSDLIGRGIDLDNVATVISYDIPLFMDKYIHRVGRTARAGRQGTAYTLVENKEGRYFKEMLRQAGHFQQLERLDIARQDLEPLEAGYQAAMDSLDQEQE